MRKCSFFNKTTELSPPLSERRPTVANNYQVHATQLTPNATVLLRGKTTFSRLAKLIEGQDLINSDANRAKNGMTPVGRPHTSINLAHAEVVFATPGQPTPEEIFVHERRYLSPKHPEHGQSYSFDNKSNNLPIVGKKNDAGEVEQIILTGDLAADLDVTLVLRVYKPKGYANCGLSLDLVLLNEEIRYYNAGVNAGELAARGIIFAAPPRQISGIGSSDEVGAAPALPANTDAATGLPAPAAAVVASPAPTVPVVQPAPVAHVQQVQPVAQVQQVAQPVETPEQELARLRAMVSSRETAAAASGGESAFGAAPAAAVTHGDPWSEPAPGAQQPVPQGISYSG